MESSGVSQPVAEPGTTRRQKPSRGRRLAPGSLRFLSHRSSPSQRRPRIKSRSGRPSKRPFKHFSRSVPTERSSPQPSPSTKRSPSNFAPIVTARGMSTSTSYRRSSRVVADARSLGLPEGCGYRGFLRTVQPVLPGWSSRPLCGAGNHSQARRPD